MYKNSKPIAILMATYNAEKYLQEQIESIFNQTSENWTLYIRDDGSTDNTKIILNDFAKKNTNVVLINDKMGNLGCRDNFFQLLTCVESKYYMFSDADDVWLPNKVEKSYNLLKEYENKYDTDYPLLVHTDLEVTDENLDTISKSMWKSGRFNPDKIKNIYYLGLHCYVGGATAIFNNAAKLVSMPFSDKVYLHDLWIALNVMKEGQIISLHESLILYRQHGTNTAGAALSDNLKISSKISNLKRTLNLNLDTARMLKKIGWGGYLKYLIYKIKLVYLLRSGKAM